MKFRLVRKRSSIASTPDAADGPERRQIAFVRTPKQEAQRIRFERKDRITALQQRSATAEAFRVALADEGFILARGDRGDLVVVDRTGAVYGLARHIPGMSATEFQEFMKDIDRGRLPSLRQAAEIHRQNWHEKREQERGRGSRPRTACPERGVPPVTGGNGGAQEGRCRPPDSRGRRNG